MQFTSVQSSNLLLSLGYGSNLTRISDAQISLIRSHLQSDFPAELVSRTIQLLTDLNDLDAKLFDATEYSMAASTGGISLNYPVHVSHLRSEASRRLFELATLLDIPIKVNKYGRSPAGAFVSYW